MPTTSNETPSVTGVQKNYTSYTKERLLDTLEQTFKTKLPCIVVSDGLPTTHYSSRAIGKASCTTYGEPPRTTYTAVHPPQRQSSGHLYHYYVIKMSRSSFPIDLPFSMRSSLPCFDEYLKYSTSSYTQIHQGLRRKSLTADVFTQTGLWVRKHKTRKVSDTRRRVE